MSCIQREKRSHMLNTFFPKFVTAYYKRCQKVEEKIFWVV